MALNATQATRVFTYNGVELPDPGVGMSVEEVRELYSATFPELATATVTAPEARGNHLHYAFQRAVGTKG